MGRKNIDDTNDKELLVNNDDVQEQNNVNIEDTIPLTTNRSETKSPSPFSSVASPILDLSYISGKNPHLIVQNSCSAPKHHANDFVSWRKKSKRAIR